jgi:predicted RNA-binding protein with RPS1 domain
VVRDAEARRLWPRDRKFESKEVTFSLGGMISHRDGAKEFVDWVHLNLKVGDTVTLKVVNADRVDAPKHRRKTAGPKIEESERRELDRLQRKYAARAQGSPSNKALQTDGASRRR